MALKLQECHVHSAQITLDGTAEHHDHRRFLKPGRPTFDRIVQNIGDVADLIRINVRVNLDRTNADSYLPLVRHLWSLGLKDKIAVYPAFTRDDGDATWDGAYPSMQAFMDDQVRLHREGVAHGIQVLGMPSTLRLFCGSSSPTFWTIAPNGDLHKCWDTINDPTRAVGNVHRGTSEGREVWESWSPFKHAKCLSCKVMPLCMGGCADKAFQHGGEPECEKWKQGLHDAIRLWVEDHRTGRTVEAVRRVVGDRV